MLYFAKSTPIGKYPFTKVTSSSVSKSKSSLEIVLNCIVCTPSWMEDFFNVPSSLFTHYLLNSCVRAANSVILGSQIKIFLAKVTVF